MVCDGWSQLFQFYFANDFTENNHPILVVLAAIKLYPCHCPLSSLIYPLFYLTSWSESFQCTCELLDICKHLSTLSAEVQPKWVYLSEKGIYLHWFSAGMGEHTTKLNLIRCKLDETYSPVFTAYIDNLVSVCVCTNVELKTWLIVEWVVFLLKTWNLSVLRVSQVSLEAQALLARKVLL